MKERKSHMKIKVLLVMPGKEVQIIKIPASIKFIKSFIGEELQRFRINENTIIIANKNPSNDEFNRIYKGNIILGTFIVVSIKNNRRVSMKKKDTRKFSNMFKLVKHEKKINR
jgi:predicted RNA-binding protein with PUA domain